jgi:parallel beta-helix repeat protein
VDHRADSGRADVRVPSARARTIAEAIDRVTDRNRDGQLIIELAPGIYRENVQIGRSLLLRGAGAERTVIRGDGSTAALTVRSANAAVMGVTVAGGTSGVVVEGDGVELSEMRSWRNLGVGFALAAGGVSLRRVKALQNGGHGLQGQGIHSTLASESELIDNGGDGIRLLSSGRLLVDANLVSDNATGGISLSSVREAVIEENRIANNVGSGLILLGSQANRIAGNMSSMNDEDGVTMDRTSANLLTANRCENNHGYGIFTRRGNDDFAADEGTQPPGGDNITSGNRKGDVFLRPD